MLENDRTAEELQRFRSQRVDTRQYLKELEKLPIMHIRCTQNNTYIDICDHTGNILTWKSAVSSFPVVLLNGFYPLLVC